MSNWSQCPNRHTFEVNRLEPGIQYKVVCPLCGAVRKLDVAYGSVSGTAGSVGTSGDRKATVDDSAVPSLPGYRVIDELGRGAFGVVYRTHDEKAGHDVALKTLIRVDPAGLKSFKAEFRSLADIAHPNIATLYDLLSDGDTWCFTMEMLDAVEFHEYVWSAFACRDDGDPPPLLQMAAEGTRLTPDVTGRLCDALKQLAFGLDALHSAGMLHRDIKHSNVLVTREGRVVLVDFGLVSGVADASSGPISGTPRFMAPEQTVGDAVSSASDWYAVGVMLYEILTGVPPFKGRPRQLMDRKRSVVPTAARELEPSIPAELNDLCMGLLSINAADRPGVIDVLRAIGAEDAIPALRAPQLIRSAASNGAMELVGRDEQLAHLRRQAANVAAGDAVTVFVSGRSGMGKSVLIERFLDEVREDRQALILTGRCYQQESVPFKALDALIDSLAEFLRAGALIDLPQESSAMVSAAQVGPSVDSLLPDDCLALLRLFPVFGQVPEFQQPDRPSIENADQQELRQRALNCLRELLRRLGERQSLVLYVDDVQWGDVDSARLIAEIMRPPDAPRLLLIGAYRSENVSNSAFLDAFHKACVSGEHHPVRAEISVDALAPEQAESLALSLLDGNDDTTRELASRIASESAGSPFFVWELASHAREVPEIGRQTLQLDEVIWSRVCRLLDDTRELLELVAVVARPIPATEAYQALEQVERGRNLLQQLRAASLIRTTDSSRNSAESATLVESYHDRIRETVAARLSDERTRAYHLKVALIAEEKSGLTEADRNGWLNAAAVAAEELTADQRDRIFELARHFSAIGRDDRALPYALKAAELARGQDALEVSEQQFRIAERCAQEASEQLRRRIANGLGDILMYSGKYRDAEERFTTVRDLAETGLARAQASAKLGELAFKQGDMLKAAMTLESALQDIGESVPQSTFGYLMRLGWESTVQILHSCAPGLFIGRKPHMSDDEYVRIGLLSRLAYVNWFARGTIPTLWTHLRELNAAERYPPSLKLAQAWSEHAAVMTTIPLHARGIHYGQHSLKIRRERGHFWGQAQSLSFLGMAFYAAGRIREAYDALSEAVGVFEQVGDWWEANLARYQLGLAAYRLGKLNEAIDHSVRVHESGLRLGDDQASGISLHVWAMATDGQVPADVLKTELARARIDAQCTAQVQLAEAIRLYFVGDLEGASSWLDEAMQVIQKKQLRSAVLSPVYTWRVRVLRTRLQRLGSESLRDRALWRQAKQALRSARLFSLFYRVEMPAAQVEAGELAVLAGRPDKALKRFNRALTAAGNLGMTHQAATIRDRIASLS